MLSSTNTDRPSFIRNISARHYSRYFENNRQHSTLFHVHLFLKPMKNEMLDTSKQVEKKKKDGCCQQPSTHHIKNTTTAAAVGETRKDQANTEHRIIYCPFCCCSTEWDLQFDGAKLSLLPTTYHLYMQVRCEVNFLQRKLRIYICIRCIKF